MTDSPAPAFELRPWGRFDILSDGNGHKVKRITVNPGCRLSYQRHKSRSEHWYLVEGSACVTLDDRTHMLAAGEAIDIPCESWHRIENTGGSDLVFIEIQTGSYFGEDDIERREDDFGRA